MAEAVSGRHRSIALIAAGTLLLVLALLEAGIAALFVLLASSERRTMLRIGNDVAVLYPDYAYNGIAIFLALCLISACGGVAAMGGWRGMRRAACAAGGATIMLGLWGLWIYANLLIPELPRIPVEIGIRATPMIFVALCVIGIIVLWATCISSRNAHDQI